MAEPTTPEILREELAKHEAKEAAQTLKEFYAADAREMMDGITGRCLTCGKLNGHCEGCAPEE